MIQDDSSLDRTSLSGETTFGAIAPAPGKDQVLLPYDPARTRENFRGLIALILIALMTGIIAAAFALLWLHPDRSTSFEHFFSLVFGPVIALVGAATGYYFGSQAANKN